MIVISVPLPDGKTSWCAAREIQKVRPNGLGGTRDRDGDYGKVGGADLYILQFSRPQNLRTLELQGGLVVQRSRYPGRLLTRPGNLNDVEAMPRYIRPTVHVISAVFPDPKIRTVPGA